MTVSRLLTVDKGLFWLVSGIAQLLLLSSVAAGFYQVIARFVLQSPADWSEAWTRASLIWTVMLGLALAFRHGAMLSVEVLNTFLGRVSRRWLEHVVLIIVVGFLIFMAWVGARMTWHVRFQTSPSLGISILWVYLSIPIGMVLAVIAVIAHWAEGPRKPMVDETTL